MLLRPCMRAALVWELAIEGRRHCDFDIAFVPPSPAARLPARDAPFVRHLPLRLARLYPGFEQLAQAAASPQLARQGPRPRQQRQQAQRATGDGTAQRILGAVASAAAAAAQAWQQLTGGAAAAVEVVELTAEDEEQPATPAAAAGGSRKRAASEGAGRSAAKQPRQGEGGRRRQKSSAERQRILTLDCNA